jgi:hypothetical protein
METPMNSFSFSVISTVSDLFSSFENYTSSSTCVDPLPSVPTLQYSNATVNEQQNMYFYLFANYAFRYLKVVHDVSLRWQIFAAQL